MTTTMIFALAFASAFASIAVLLAWFVDDESHKRYYRTGVSATAISLVMFAGIVYQLSNQTTKDERPIVTIKQEITLEEAMRVLVKSRVAALTEEANGVRSRNRKRTGGANPERFRDRGEGYPGDSL